MTRKHVDIQPSKWKKLSIKDGTKHYKLKFLPSWSKMEAEIAKI